MQAAEHLAADDRGRGARLRLRLSAFVALAKRAISNSTAPGEAVLDLFGGSGSTVIAAEQTGRRALVVELDPRFIDVILARWEAVSGQEARRSDCAALEVEHA